MPELGDVEGFRRVVSDLRGARIERVDVTDGAVLRNASVGELRQAVLGRRIGTATRVGKWLSIDVGDVALVVHFGMTGSLRRAAPSTAPEPSDRVAIGTSRGELRFRDPRRLGRWALLRPTAVPSTVTGPLGPDALSLANGQLRALLHGSRGAVKSALMDQTRLAGIGNFLSDEICWRAGVDPARRADLLGDEEWAALQRAS